MWFLVLLILIGAMILMGQFIQRLPGEHFPGILKRFSSNQHKSTDQGLPIGSWYEDISGETDPYFDTVLALNVISPHHLRVNWKLPGKLYERILQIYRQEHVDTEKAVLRLDYLNSPTLREEYPIRLYESNKDLFLRGADCEIAAEIGFYTQEHRFIPIVHSNHVHLPK